MSIANTTSNVDVELETEGGDDQEPSIITAEVDLPDGVSLSDLTDKLSHIRVVDDEAGDRGEDGAPEMKKASYRDWDEMKAVADLKSGDGVWHRINCLPLGSEVKFGDIKGFTKEQNRLERAFRAQHPKYLKKGKDGKLRDLPDETKEDLFLVASFGKSILDWRGPGFCHGDGTPVPFTLENFSLAANSFEELSSQLLDNLMNINPAALEAVRKNS